MTQLEPIESADDERISEYANMRERDLRRGSDRFVAEGRVVLDALLRSDRFEPVSLFLLRNRIAGLEDMIERVPTATPIYVAEAGVMDRVVGFPIHRGVLAIARRTKTADTAALLASAERVLVCCNLANHDNVGSILRSAAAFGVDAVLFDRTSADPLYRKAIRVSAGAALTLPHVHGGSSEELLDMVEAAGLRALALSPSGSVFLDEVRAEGRIALVVGAEGKGLPSLILDRLETVRIDMVAGHDSLNVGVATAIALHAIKPSRGETL